jgi:cellulose 1,4-beta-cellobiosidase
LALLALLPLCATALSAGPNPFAKQSLYVNPTYVAELDSSIANSTGKVKQTLESIRSVSSAYWLDIKAKIQSNGTPGETYSMEGILQDAAGQHPVPVVTFIVYDLPNRDCNAKASNGEICCTYNADGTCDYTAGGSCEAGLKEYKNTYIDPITALLKQYQHNVPIVLVIEPDSLPNLATNLGECTVGQVVKEAGQGVDSSEVRVGR